LGERDELWGNPGTDGTFFDYRVSPFGPPEQVVKTPPGSSPTDRLANSLIPKLILAQNISPQVCRLFLRNRYPYLRVKKENLLSKKRAASGLSEPPVIFLARLCSTTGAKPQKAPLSH
jgi:hypothetical protein